MTFSFFAAFLTGFSGSAHCLAMCGGIGSALGMRARSTGLAPSQVFMHTLLYQLGRLLSYTVAGALCGAVGGGLLHLLDVARATNLLRMLVALLLLLLGVQLCFGWRLLAPIEALGAKLWRYLLPLSARYTAYSQWLQALLLGAIWGWLPCGLVYSMLLLGVLGGTATHGAGVMLAFALGTLPAMFASSILASQLARVSLMREIKLLSGLLLMVFGLWTLMMIWQH